MGNILKTLKFKRMSATPTIRTVVPNHLIPEDCPQKEQPNRRYATNKIETTKYSLWSFLPKNLFEQFHRFANLYFVFIVLLNWVPAINAFGKEVAMIPVIFVLCVTALKDAFEDYRRYKSDKKINNLSCRVYSQSEKKYVRQKWEDIRVGDFVHLSCNEVIPADMILLHSSDDSGICHIDTSNLDGENNLKQRQIVWGLRTGDDFMPSMFAHTVECELPNMQIYKFNGAILLAQSGDKVSVSRNNILLRGCIIRNTDFVEGIVVYAGHDTKALMNNRGPRHKRSKLERQINRDVMWCVVALFLMCFMCSLGAGLWQEQFEDVRDIYFIPYGDEDRYNSAYHSFLIFWTYVILFQVMIPISLYVTIEFVKLGQVYFIQEDVNLYYEPADKRIECRALNITEDLGQIEYVFSDKTGTLTENMMVFKRCSIAGTDYFPPTEAKEVDENGVNGKAALDQTLDSEPSNAFELVTFQENMLMEPTMRKAVSRMSVNSMSGIDLELPEEIRKIQEFFLLMTICNTVVVSTQPHHDKMDSSGVVHEDTSDSSLGKKLRSKIKNGKLPNHRKKNNSPYGTFAGRPGSSPAAGSNLENVSEDPEDSSVSGEASSSYEVSSTTDFSTKPNYEAESPDELALVQAACTYGCKLVKRTPDRVIVWLPDQGEIMMRTLHILPFDSNRKRMSVIVEHPITKEIILYCKGADSAIFTNLKPKTGDEEEEDLWRNTMDHLTTYAKEGLRTLCMAKRILSEEEYRSWLRIQEAAETSLDDRDKLLYNAACEIETNLELLGATGIEDRLQDGVPETIASLRAAGIKVWVLTGDKQETALNIASACHLISFEQKLIVLNARNKDHAKDLIDNHLDMLENRQNPIVLGESMRSRSIRSHSIPGNIGEETDENGVTSRPGSSQSSLSNGYFGNKKPEKPQAALVIDGKTLAYALDSNLEEDFLRLASHCSSVVCCRATPFQKSALVKLVRDNLKKMTLAIGDGANDVAMIQTADVGIGISGQEGMQAVMSSDFALARFRFLKRLLLVHGHWCYERLAKMTLYMFYKNAVYIFMLMWYQMYCGFSGGTMVDDLNLMFFNLIYTSLPPIIYGIFDRCASDDILLAYPQLYKRGPKNKAYRKYSYFVAMADATWQSLVEFFVPYFIYYGSEAGYWEFGVTCNAASVYATLLHLCMDTKYWSYPHWFGLLLTLVVYFGFNVVYGIICTGCSPPANPYWVPQHTWSTAIHWFTVLIVVILALGPRFCLRLKIGI